MPNTTDTRNQTIDNNLSPSSSPSSGATITGFSWNNATDTLTLQTSSGNHSVILPNNSITVVDNLTAGGSSDALSAEQGKVLKAELDLEVAKVAGLTYDSPTTTLTFTNKEGAVTNIDLSALTTDIYVDGATFDAAAMTLTFTDNDGVTPDVVVDLSTLRSDLTENSDRTYTHNDGNGTVVTIDANTYVPDHDPAQAYKENHPVLRGGVLYRCKADIAAKAWDDADWDKVGSSAKDHYFLDHATIAPAPAGTPATQSELETFIGTLALTDQFVVYTGTSVATDNVLFIYHVDESGALLKLYEFKNSEDPIATLEEVNQVAHGFTVLQPVRHDGSSWVSADATASDNTAQGVVTQVVDVDNFVVTTHGAATVTAHGLTVGEYYWLDQTSSALTITMPSTGIAQSLLHVRDANTIMVDTSTPVELGGVNTAFTMAQIPLASMTLVGAGATLGDVWVRTIGNSRTVMGRFASYGDGNTKTLTLPAGTFGQVLAMTVGRQITNATKIVTIIEGSTPDEFLFDADGTTATSKVDFIIEGLVP